MSTITGGRAAQAITHRGPARALGVAGAAAAAVTVWAIAGPGPGIGLLIRFGTCGSQAVRTGLAAGAALAASVCGWGLLAMLEGRTRHARTTSATVAVAAAIASVSLPAVAGITVAAAAALALALMHLAVAAVLVPALCRSAARQDRRPAASAHRQQLGFGVLKPCDPSP